MSNSLRFPSAAISNHKGMVVGASVAGATGGGVGTGGGVLGEATNWKLWMTSFVENPAI